MTATPPPTKVQLARKKLLYIFILGAIGWLSLSAFLPPLIIFSLLDFGLLFLIWHGSSFAKFLTVPLFLGRGLICLFVILGDIAAVMNDSRDAGPAFFAAMLPGFIAFAIYSLGVGIALLFIPNIAEIRKTSEFYAENRAMRERRLKAHEALQIVETVEHADMPSVEPTSEDGVESVE